MAASPAKFPSTAPGSLACGLRVASHNVQGLTMSSPTGDAKWCSTHVSMSKLQSLVFLWAVVLRLDVVCVQETHIRGKVSASNPRGEQSIQNALDHACVELHLPYTYTCFWDHGPSGRQGVGVLIRSSLLSDSRNGMQVLLSKGGGDGRRVAVKVKWAGHSFHILNMYLPCQGQDQSKYLSAKGIPWLRTFAPSHATQLLLAGDFNMALASDAMDSVPGYRRSPVPHSPTSPAQAQQQDIRTYTTAATRAFTSACSDLGLHDCYRHKHPHTRTFTCIHPDRCRLLDRIFVSHSMLQHVEQCHVDVRTVSDHRPVVLHLRPARAQVAHGPAPLPRLRVDFLRHADLVDSWQSWFEEQQQAAPADQAQLIDWWGSSFKPALIGQVRQLNATARQLAQGYSDRDLQAANAALQAAFVEYEAEGGSTAESLQRVLDAKHVYVQAVNAHMASAVQQAKYSWVHEHERVRHHWSKVFSKPRSAREIAALRSPAGGGLVTAPEQVASLLGQHYAAISQCPTTATESERQAKDQATHEVLSALRTEQPVDPDLAATAGSPFVSMQEVLVALSGLPRGRSPGPDGIPAQLWRMGGEPAAALLASLFTAIGTLNTTPRGFTHGAVIPVPKPGSDPALPASYRPITLLNTDYRILGRVLSQRFGGALALHVPPEQTAFLPGRLIGDSILFMQLLPDALRAAGQSAVIAFLDFAKAYDTVDRDFLYAAMESTGMGDAVHWVRTLLADCQACCVANQAASPLLFWGAGVRQGCPLSPVLYLFIGWALRAWLHAQPSLGVTIAGRRHVCSQYADDTRAVLQGLQEGHVQSFLGCMHTFGVASGQRLNASKCSLLCVGAEPLPPHQPLPQQVCGIPVVTSVKALGVVCTDRPPSADQVSKYWGDILSKVTTAYDRLACMHLSSMGRGMAASCYGVSRFLYQAEFMGPPPASVLQTLLQQSKLLVDKGGNGRMPPGIPSALLVGPPSKGGFGLLPIQQHITGRHLVWACRLLTFCVRYGRDKGVAALPALQHRRLSILKRLDKPDLSAIARSRLLRELTIFDLACSCSAPWLHLAYIILQRVRPSMHPAFAMLDMAAVPVRCPSLPLALLRMVQALQAMGTPALDPAFPLQLDARQVAAMPLWGHPLLALEQPRLQLSMPPGARPWAAQPQVVQWVGKWMVSGFQHFQAPALSCVASLRSLHTLSLAPDWRSLTASGGAGLQRWLGQGRLLPDDMWLPLMHHAQCAHACLAGVDAMWHVVPAPWRALLAALPLDHVPPVQDQRDVVAVVVDALTWMSRPLEGRPSRPAVPLLVGGTVRQATSYLSYVSVQQRHDAWQQYVEEALRPPSAVVDLPDSLDDLPPHQPQQQQQEGTQHGAEPGLAQGVRQLSSLFKQAWRLPWHNHCKETFWRLAVQGVPWAGGHGLVPPAACQCGWDSDRGQATSVQALAWREHCFWSCPIAQGVVAHMQAALPTGPSLQRKHVWLLESPDDFVVRGDVWLVVCLAALSAMHLGRRVLYAMSVQDQASQGEVQGLRQASLEELWHLSVQSQELAPTQSPVHRARCRAAAEFWALLQDFVCMHHAWYQGPWWGAGDKPPLPTDHPFLCGVLGINGGLSVHVPDHLPP